MGRLECQFMKFFLCKGFKKSDFFSVVIGFLIFFYVCVEGLQKQVVFHLFHVIFTETAVIFLVNISFYLISLQMSGWWAWTSLALQTLPVRAPPAVAMDTAGHHAVGLLSAGGDQWIAAGLASARAHAGTRTPTSSVRFSGNLLQTGLNMIHTLFVQPV